jgi:hypothetical protein
LDLPALAKHAGYPATTVIPAVSYLLSLLALKLVGIRRVSHVDDLAADAGASSSSAVICVMCGFGPCSLRSRVPPLEEPSMRKQHVVVLSEEERARLRTPIGQGTAPARALTHARILLNANQGEAGPGWTDRAIAVALEVHHTTVARVRQQYATGGLDVGR